jgi:aspartyl-tRNA(Asn)/glutamyl-tRNA(Gln) amidotransferase subunit A
VVSYADSLDTVGVLAQDVSQVEKVFKHINKHDLNDPTSADERSRRMARDLAREKLRKWDYGNLRGLRIGIPQEYFPSELSSPSNPIISSIRRVLSFLHSLGATILPVSLPSTQYALSAYYVIASAEGSSCLSRYDGIQYGMRVEPPPGSDLTLTSKIYAHTRSLGFGREVQKRILLGTYALSADAFDNYFLQAQRVRQMVRDDFDRVFSIPNVLASEAMNSLSGDSVPKQDTVEDIRTDGVDVLIHPSAIRTAPLLDDVLDYSKERDILQDYVQDVLTVPASLAGLPAVGVPVRSAQSMPEGGVQDAEKGDGNGWPIGVSIVGQWGSDELVLKVGRVVEQFSR